MTVVPFTPRVATTSSAQPSGPWSAQELATLVSIYEAHAAAGDASGWDVGATEVGDPQFYILGLAPDLDCAMTISRVGRLYVRENGAGQVLDEDPSLTALAARARTPATVRGRLTLGLAALAFAVRERTDALLMESEEVLLRLVPQLATLV